MTDDILQIEIDGKQLPAHAGQMLIEVTDNSDIYIPRFCYHKKLSVAANCRMCLVEIENAPKPLPACATPVTEGMKVHTRSKLALEAQKSVMEFLLINHPLDCPICDQGGECELQDLAMGYGGDVSRYQEGKRVVVDKNIGPLIQTDMTRCIHCTRCVRFGEEIAGLRELGVTGRGEHMEIGTYIEHSVSSELSGNIIDVCPVGALTSKPFRYSARAWEIVQRSSIAPHDSVGSNVYLHIKDDRIKRVVPAENEAVNEVWLSDRDRFSYEGLYSEDRLHNPMIKRAGSWQETDWGTALDFASSSLRKILLDHGGEQLGGLASAGSTLEELYLFQKLLRALDCNNIDHRLRQKDFSQQQADPVFPYLGGAIAELEDIDSLLLIGSNIRKEQPMINHRLRKSVLRGAEVMVLNSIDYDFNYDVADKIIEPPARLPGSLLSIIKALVEMSGDKLATAATLISMAEVTETHRQIATKLYNAEKGLILLGNLAIAHEQFSILKVLALTIARLSSSRFGFISEAANSSGAHLAGVLPHRGVGGKNVDHHGLDADAMLAQSLKSYMLLGIEPELDCHDGQQALSAMQAAEFVISMTAYQSDLMKQYADVLLPIALFGETPGTYINVAGQSQSFSAATPPVGEARPAWKIMRVLAERFNIEHCVYDSYEDIQHDINAAISNIVPYSTGRWAMPQTLNGNVGDQSELQRITDVPAYRIDAMTRRAKSLQQKETVPAVQINAVLASKLNIVAGDEVIIDQQEKTVRIPVTVNQAVPNDCILVAAACHHSYDIGPWHGQVSLRKA